MSTSKGYRFSLQWAANTSEQIEIGEFLEKLGNRKSAYLLQAAYAYKNSVTDAASTPQAVHTPRDPQISSVSKEQFEQMIRRILSETNSPAESGGQPQPEEKMLEGDISAMLDNLLHFDSNQ